MALMMMAILLLASCSTAFRINEALPGRMRTQSTNDIRTTGANFANQTHKALMTLGNKIARGPEVSFPAPFVKDIQWGCMENGFSVSDQFKSIGSHMTVLDFQASFGIANGPNRFDIRSSFRRYAALGGSGMSGADMFISGDGSYVAKKIYKIEVRYLHKIVRALSRNENSFARKLLSPVYYLFQRCSTYSTIPGWDLLFSIEKVPDNVLRALDAEEAQSLWAGCEAWMVTPAISAFPSVRGTPVLRFDIKGAGQKGIPDPDGDKFREAFPDGLGLQGDHMQQLCTYMFRSTSILRDLDIFDYSLFVVVTDKGEGPCVASSDTLIFPAANIPLAPNGPVMNKCVALAIIDFLGHPSIKFARWAKRQSEIAGQWNDDNVDDYQKVFMKGTLQCNSWNSAAIIKNMDYLD